MWQSKREISRECNDIIGSAKGSQEFLEYSTSCKLNVKISKSQIISKSSRAKNSKGHKQDIKGRLRSHITGTCFIPKIYAPSYIVI
jgi:hypothetical protein